MQVYHRKSDTEPSEAGSLTLKKTKMPAATHLQQDVYDDTKHGMALSDEHHTTHKKKKQRSIMEKQTREAQQTMDPTTCFYKF